MLGNFFTEAFSLNALEGGGRFESLLFSKHGRAVARVLGRRKGRSRVLVVKAAGLSRETPERRDALPKRARGTAT